MNRLVIDGGSSAVCSHFNNEESRQENASTLKDLHGDDDNDA